MLAERPRPPADHADARSDFGVAYEAGALILLCEGGLQKDEMIWERLSLKSAS